MIRPGCPVFLALAICVAVPAPSDAGQRPELGAIVAASIDQHIIPSYAALRDDAEKLAGNVAAWCESGGGGGPERASVDGSFRRTVLSWAAVAFIRFGPARADARQQRLAFFPDPRGVTARQLSATLARRDPALLEAGALAKQSAAIQGLPALELLLTQRGPDSTAKIDAYGCALATAISANVAILSRELAEEWAGGDGWRARMAGAGPDNPAYKTHEEAAGELVKAVLTGLQIVRDQGFVAIQQAAEKGRTRIGLAFERSGLARDYLAASVRSCASLITTLRLGDFVKDDPKFGWMSGWIANALRSLEGDIQEMTMTAAAAETRPKGTDRVHRGRFYANGLRQIIGRQVAPAAGLTLGFNELDGD